MAVAVWKGDGRDGAAGRGITTCGAVANPVLAENSIHAGQVPSYSSASRRGVGIPQLPPEWRWTPRLSRVCGLEDDLLCTAVRRTGTAVGVFACGDLGVWCLGCGGVPTFGGSGWVYYLLCELSGCPFVRA